MISTMLTRSVIFFVLISVFFALVMFISGGYYASGNALMSFNDCLDVVFKKQWLYSGAGALCLSVIYHRWMNRNEERA